MKILGFGSERKEVNSVILMRARRQALILTKYSGRVLSMSFSLDVLLQSKDGVTEDQALNE